MIIQEKSFDKARKKIRALEKEGKRIVFTSEDDELNRKILEKEKINTLLLSQKGRKDFQKQRNSGLNQVLAKIAKSKGVSIGIDLDEIIESKPEEKTKILARVRQNIKLCNKNKLEMKFISQKTKNKRTSHDVKSLGLVLGMPTSITKNL